MRKIDKDELKTILKKHMMWLNGEDGGEKADLSGSDLRGSDLIGSNLRWSNLSRSDLRGSVLSRSDLRGSVLSRSDLRGSDLSGSDMRWADMSGANMSRANMSRANMRWADMRWADMRWADMSRANMRWADMSGADMRWADMSGADMSGVQHIESVQNLFYPLTCPEKGEYTAFKKADEKIIELRIPADAKRLSATGRKCRASKAVVVSITELDGTPAGDEVCSDYDKNFVYRIGETVEVQNFDENRWNECAPGIYHYITREEAVRH